MMKRLLLALVLGAAAVGTAGTLVSAQTAVTLKALPTPPAGQTPAPGAAAGLAAAFEIRAIPTLVVLKDGVLLGALPGAMPAKAIDELVGKLKALDMEEIRRKIDEVELQEPRVAKAGGG